MPPSPFSTVSRRSWPSSISRPGSLSSYTSDDEDPRPTISLPYLMFRASQHFSRPCSDARRFARGSSSDIYVLSFSKDDSADTAEKPDESWICLAKVKIRAFPPEVLQSEIDTMKYIKTHSTIPVPEVYFFNLDPNNQVGAQFMIIENLPGKSLYDAWDNDLSFDDLLSIVTDIAHIHVQLSALHFDQIGSIKADGTIGPVYYPLPDGTVGSMGPFTSTREYLLSHLPTDSVFSETSDKIRNIINNYMESNDNLSLSAPYRIFHEDFHAQNILVSLPGPDSPARVTGIIDWEYAHTTPVNFFYDYPSFIWNNWDAKEWLRKNATLRKRFRDVLSAAFPEGSREAIEYSLSMDKNFTLNGFQNRVMPTISYSTYRLDFVKEYLETVESGNGRVYEDGPEEDEVSLYESFGSDTDEIRAEDEGEDEDENKMTVRKRIARMFKKVKKTLIRIMKPSQRRTRRK